MQIVVLGMHRSGTSALTRLLDFIGCHLGAEADFTPPRSDNPTGDWERTDVWALNEEILSAQNASWCRIGAFDAENLPAAGLAQFRERAGVIAKSLDSQRPWAIKDPRLCVTLPVWRPAFSDPVCLIVHRNPLQVAQSLARRDGFPLSVGIALWEAHVLASLRHSRGLPRVSVSHADLMADPSATLRTLRQHLEIEGVKGLHAPDDQQVQAFIDPSLLHGSDDPIEQSAHLNPPQQRLARALENGSAILWDNVPALSAGAEDLIQVYFKLLDERERLQATVDGAMTERDAKAGALEKKAAEVERLAAARDAAEEHARSCDALAREHEDNANRYADLLREKEAAFKQYAEQAQLEHTRARDLEERARLQHTRARQDQARAEQNLLRANRLQEQQRRTENDLDRVLSSSAQLETLLQLLLASRRWRFGDNVGEWMNRITLRSRQPRAAEHAEQVIANFKTACSDVAQRRAESKDD